MMGIEKRGLGETKDPQDFERKSEAQHGWTE